jgi:hypothetical protein
MISIGDANDPATILSDSDVFYSTYCASANDDQVAVWEAGNFGPSWGLGAHAAAMVQMHDLVAPLDPARAARYLERLRQIADALLQNRDDNRDAPMDPFRRRVMPAWGQCASDRDWQWNTDVSTSALFTYPMAAFGRRVADHPTRYAQYHDDAIHFITAAIETFSAFLEELHLTETDAWAYFIVPRSYSTLQCNGNHACEVYRDTAGQPLAYNENLSMMKALAEVALASDSALYRGSPDANPVRLQLATKEAPLVIAKNCTFFEQHLRPKTLSDGTPYFEWDHQLPEPRYIQNVPHGGFELGCLAALLDDKIRLNVLLQRAGRSERVGLKWSLLVGFANTFLRMIWKDDTLSEKVDGTGDRGDQLNLECAGWIPLAQFDPWVWTRCRDTTDKAPFLREDNHAALLRYRQFNSMKYLTDFAGQNWLITPAALAVGEHPPASILDQKWLLVLSGVVIADLKGDSGERWEYQTVSFTPDMAGPDDPSSTSGPLNWAINHYSIPKPPGSPGVQYLIRFSVEELVPFASLSSIFNQDESINSGFSVEAWRPNHFGIGTDVMSERPVNNLFNGINVDIALRDTDAWIYRLSYNITLIGKIVFVAPAF